MVINPIAMNKQKDGDCAPRPSNWMWNRERRVVFLTLHETKKLQKLMQH